MRRQVAKGSRRSLGLAGATWLGIHAVAQQHPTHRWYDTALYAFMAFAVFLWIVSTDAVAFRLPSVSFRRQGRSRMLVYNPPQRSWRGKRDLRARADRLSKTLLAFLGEWTKNDPFRQRMPTYRETQHLSPDEWSKQWQEISDLGTAYMAEQMKRYSVEYSVEALALCDEFIGRGIAEERDRWIFETTTGSSLDIQEIAQMLGVWAKKL